MAIAFSCPCGTDFEVPDDMAGLHAPFPSWSAGSAISYCSYRFETIAPAVESIT
jgi:hypothetical protein